MSAETADFATVFGRLRQLLLDELATLTAKGLERYVAAGYVSPAP